MSHNVIVSQIQSLSPITNADRIQMARVLGENVIVGLDSAVGDIGLLFQADLQLSEEYCFENNLYRYSHLNKDNTKQGFFDENRRVRSQAMRGVKSDAYFAPLSSLEYTGAILSELKVMDQFNELNGHPLCEKYISQESRNRLNSEANGKQKPQKYNAVPDFVKHVDTDQFKHYVGFIPKGAILSFHAKKHGTSFRVGYLKEYTKLPKWKELINKLVPVFPTYQWKYEVGTRNVILSSPEKEGFHGSEQYRYDVLESLKPYLDKGMIIFGEIVGYVNGKSIMPQHSIEALKNKEYTKKYGKNVTYKYNCNEAEFKFHVYRIAYATEDGKIIDFTNDQVDSWCKDRNLVPPLSVHDTIVYDGDQEKLSALVEQLTERPEVLTEDYEDSSHISEGIIVRWDRGNLVPKFYKSKSWAFRCAEGMVEAVDEESVN